MGMRPARARGGLTFHWASSAFWKCRATDTKLGALALFEERFKMVCKIRHLVHDARAVHVQTICTLQWFASSLTAANGTECTFVPKLRYTIAPDCTYT